ncbi:MAG: hypothetical protein ACE5JP_01625 [Candidatus Bipolaricaulia bacterium]
MAETERTSMREWGRRAKVVLGSLVLVGLGFLIGLYAVAPTLMKGKEGYLPPAVVEMPAGTIRVTTPDGTVVLLPVRIAETFDARTAGLREVGTKALDTTFLLYAQTREVTRRTSYNMTGIRTPLELAIIDVDGKVMAIKQVALETESLIVTEPHRWVLAAKDGLLLHVGIVVESTLDTAAIRKIG